MSWCFRKSTVMAYIPAQVGERDENFARVADDFGMTSIPCLRCRGYQLRERRAATQGQRRASVRKWVFCLHCRVLYQGYTQRSNVSCCVDEVIAPHGLTRNRRRRLDWGPRPSAKNSASPSSAKVSRLRESFACPTPRRAVPGLQSFRVPVGSASRTRSFTSDITRPSRRRVSRC